MCSSQSRNTFYGRHISCKSYHIFIWVHLVASHTLTLDQNRDVIDRLPKEKYFEQSFRLKIWISTNKYVGGLQSYMNDRFNKIAFIVMVQNKKINQIFLSAH